MSRVWRLRLVVATAVALALAGAAPAHADLSYPDFESTGGLTLNGHATTADGRLRLTTAEVDRGGSAFTDAAVVDPSGSFSTRFSAQMHGASGEHADGMAFVLQSDPRAAAAIGTHGQFLGYGHFPGYPAAIATSLAVELDTYDNGDFDPSSNHVGIALNGASTATVAAASPDFEMYGASAVHVWIDYDAASGTLRVYVDDADTKPATPLITHSVDLEAALGGPVRAGFTAGTGGTSAVHDVLSWSLTTPALGPGDFAAMTLSGNAALADHRLRLTSGESHRGGAFTTAAGVDPNHSFTASFVAQMHGGGSEHGDGIAFLVQADPRGAEALGNVGGTIGYGTSGPGTPARIEPSVAVELDTYDNGPHGVNDPNANHVGIALNGDIYNTVAAASPDFTMQGAGAVYVWVEYDAFTDALRVYVDDAPSKPSSPLLTHTVDLQALLGGPARAGFTSGTGGAWAIHDVLGWSFDAVNPSSTTVSCAPEEVDLGATAACTATVTDTAAAGRVTPTGTVAFGDAASGSCTLVATATPGVASCTRPFEPASAGAHTVSATWPGDAAHLGSSGSTSVSAVPTASFTVNTLADGRDEDTGDGVCEKTDGQGDCTLRAALDSANANGGEIVDRVGFSVTGTHTLDPALGQLAVENSTRLTIDGNGSGPTGTVVSGADAVRVIAINQARTTLKDLRVRDGFVGNGSLTSCCHGAGIFNARGTLELENVVVAENVIDITAGGATGAGISSDGPIDITGSSIESNVILSEGGTGVGLTSHDPFTLRRSTIANNSAPPGGGSGGIYQSNFRTTPSVIANSTITGNTGGSSNPSTAVGGVFSGTKLEITNSTIAGNAGERAGALLLIGGEDAITTIRNSIVAAGSGAACATNGVETITADHSIDDGTSCGFGSSDGNRSSTDPLLGPLADNGGPTKTRAPTAASPAVGGGDAATCAAAPVGGVDQRGVARPQGAACDIGAVERALAGTSTAVSCSPASVAPGESTTCTATVTDTAASNPSAPTGTVTFGGAASGQSCALAATATAGEAACSVSFAPASSGSVTASYAGDASHSGSDGSGSVTVVTPLTATVGNTSVAEGNSGSADLTFTVTLNRAAGGGETVDFATANGSATAGSDYESRSGTLTFDAGDTSRTVTVSVNGDTTWEPDETLTLALSNPSGLTLGSPSTGTGTIQADDKRPTSTTVECSPASVTEGSSTSCAATVADTASGTQSAPTGSVTFGGAASGRSCTLAATATAGEAGCSVSFAPAASGSVTASYPGDASHSGSDGGSSVTVTPAPPSATVGNASVAEGNADSANLTFTVTLSRAAAGGEKVDFATANDSATAGSDYIARTGTLTFAAGETSRTVNVEVNGDTSWETNETLTLTLSNPSGLALGNPASATGTITNDDKRATSTSLECTPATFNEGSSTNCVATVQDRSGGTKSAPAGTVTFGGAADGSCTLAPTGAEGEAACNRGVTPASTGTQQVTAAWAGDELHAGSDDSMTIEVTTGPPELTITGPRRGVTEGGVATFRFVLSKVPSENIVIPYQTKNGTAVAPGDYASRSDAVQFDAGDNVLTRNVTVQTVGDTVHEPDEVFSIDVTAPASVSLARSEYRGRIIDNDPPPQPAPAPEPEITGFADLHAHQFSNLAFGGLLVAGKPFDPGDDIAKALPWSDFVPTEENAVVGPTGATVPRLPFFGLPPFPNIPETCPGDTGTVLKPCMGVVQHGPAGAGDIWNFAITGGHTHQPGGFPEFDGWPHWKTVTGQQMYYEWLQRAWRGGLRLMTMLAVNNETICSTINRYASFGCDDMSAVDRQIQAAKELEAFIDSKYGGEGKGWYQIARSASEAREIAKSGRLAVVLGVEVPSLFGCKPGGPCTKESVTDAVRHYHSLGVRQVFPIHNADNAFGGTALYEPLFNLNNKKITGSFWDIGGCPDPKIDFHFGLGNLPPAYNAVANVVGLPPAAPDGPNCNNKGLTELGAHLVNELANRGMIIDIDHTSMRTFDGILDIVEDREYGGIASSHTGFVEMGNHGQDKRHEGNKTAGQVARIKEVGGLVGVILHQGSRAEVAQHGGPTSVPFTCGESSQAWAQAYLHAVETLGLGAVAIGSDFNGLAGMPAPRFERSPAPNPTQACGGDHDKDGYSPQNPVDYESGGGFSIPGTNERFGRMTAGSRTFDYNFDGLANAGMLPDFIEDLERQGLAGRLDPLFKSAEGYLDMWERAEAAPKCTIVGTAGDDTLTGTSGDDVLCGLGGMDRLLGGAGNDTLIGGQDSDSLEGGAGADTIRGGRGFDYADYANRDVAVDVSLDGDKGDDGAAGEGDSVASDVEAIDGGSASDKLTGSGSFNELKGGDGNDELTGVGGDGGNVVHDVIAGGAGNDTLTGSGGRDSLLGGDGDDRLAGLGGVDNLQGDGGSDTADFSTEPNRTIDLAAGTVNSGDALSSVENAQGSAFADTIRGTDGGNVLRGGGGDDTLVGRGDAGAEEDVLDGDGGSDTIDLSYAIGTGRAVEIGSRAVAATDCAGLLCTNGGDDADRLEEVENVIGTAQSDTITSSGAANDIRAGAGDDTIRARDHTTDSVDCGPGADRAVTDLGDPRTDCETEDLGLRTVAGFDEGGAIDAITLNRPEARSGRPGDAPLRLTSAANQAASAFTNAPVINPARSFRSSFRLQQRRGSDSLGEGLAFVLQRDPRGAEALGGAGHLLGLSSAAASERVNPSVAVEFDLRPNAVPGVADVGAGHVAVTRNGDLSQNLAVESWTPLDGDGREPLSAVVEYDAIQKRLRLFGALGDGDLEELLNVVVDLESLLGGPAHAGFTAGTSSNWAVQDVLSWKLEASGRDSTTTVDCSPATLTLGEGATCTAVVEDQDTKGNVAPAGNVSFDAAGRGSFSAGGACALVPDGARQSRCSVTYTPGLTGTAPITATYVPAGEHLSSVATTQVTGGERFHAPVPIPIPDPGPPKPTPLPDPIPHGGKGTTQVGPMTLQTGTAKLGKTDPLTVAMSDCDAPAGGSCTVTTDSQVTYTPPKKKSKGKGKLVASAARRVKLKRVRLTVPAGESRPIRVVIGKKLRKQLKGAKATLTLSISTKDTTGKTGKAKLKVKIKT